jgi:hypothetical protein
MSRHLLRFLCDHLDRAAAEHNYQLSLASTAVSEVQPSVVSSGNTWV